MKRRNGTCDLVFMDLGVEVRTRFLSWRMRADVPGMMTGSYRVVLTVDRVTGTVTYDRELRDVRRTG